MAPTSGNTPGQDHRETVRRVGLEPTTRGLRVCCYRCRPCPALPFCVGIYCLIALPARISVGECQTGLAHARTIDNAWITQAGTAAARRDAVLGRIVCGEGVIEVGERFVEPPGGRMRQPGLRPDRLVHNPPSPSCPRIGSRTSSGDSRGRVGSLIVVDPGLRGFGQR